MSEHFPIPSEQTAKYFEPVLKWLDAGAPHDDKGIGFNMNHFHYTPLNTETNGLPYDYETKDCGTACCIAGSLLQFNWIDSVQKTDIGTIGDRAGLTHQQCCELFFVAPADQQYADEDCICFVGGLLEYVPFERITPAMAAHAIRTMLETGRPDWEGHKYAD